MSRSITNILLIVAMEIEAKPVIREFNLRPSPGLCDKNISERCYKGSYNGYSLFLVINGVDKRHDVDEIGLIAASVVSLSTLQNITPDLVINAGTAGGFAKNGAKIGSVYLSGDKFVFHDREVPIEGFRESAEGHIPALDVSKMAKDLGLSFGLVSSGSSLKRSESDMSKLIAFNAVAKDMEASAIAYVCWKLNSPFLALKSITNLLDESESSEQQFTINAGVASEKLSVALSRVVRYAFGKKIDDLSDGKSLGVY